MKNRILLLFYILYFFMQFAIGSDEIVPRNLTASSLRSLDAMQGGKYGESRHRYNIDALPAEDSVSSFEDGKCCETVYTNERTVKCSIVNMGGYYVVWGNYLTACCIGGRSEWEKIKDLLLPHENSHKSKNEEMNKDVAPITIRVLKEISKKECNASKAEAKRLATEACEKAIKRAIDDFKEYCNTQQDIIDLQEVKPTNINACTCE